LSIAVTPLFSPDVTAGAKAIRVPLAQALRMSLRSYLKSLELGRGPAKDGLADPEAK
jgi:hypothetical protein